MKCNAEKFINSRIKIRLNKILRPSATIPKCLQPKIFIIRFVQIFT